MVKKLLLLVFPVIATSCMALTTFDTSDIKKGMSFPEVYTHLNVFEKRAFYVKVSSSAQHEYFVEAYRAGYHPNYYDYFVAYEDKRVLFWGHPYEFNRHENPLINEIGLKAMEEYNKVRP